MARKEKSLEEEESLFYHLRTIFCRILSYTKEDHQEPGNQTFLLVLLDQTDGEAQGISNRFLPAQHTFQGASATLNLVLQAKLKRHLRRAA